MTVLCEFDALSFLCSKPTSFCCPLYIRHTPQVGKDMSRSRDFPISANATISGLSLLYYISFVALFVMMYAEFTKAI